MTEVKIYKEDERVEIIRGTGAPTKGTVLTIIGGFVQDKGQYLMVLRDGENIPDRYVGSSLRKLP